MVNEDFICENCGKDVEKSSYTARDHCPYCLYSKHVDINPGDNLIVLGDEGNGIAIIKEKGLLGLLNKMRKKD